MQEQDKSTTILDLMLRKYGMVGKKKAATPKQKHLQKKITGKDTDTQQSWAYASITEGTDCDGQEYMTAGVKLNNCFVDGHVYKTGMVLTCDGGEIAYHLYDNDDCSGSPTESTTVAVEGCQQPSQAIINSWWSFDDDYYQKVIPLVVLALLTYVSSLTLAHPIHHVYYFQKSVNIQCQTDNAPPSYGKGNYDAWKVFSDAGTCDADDYTLFEAYRTDVCIPIQVFYTRTDDQSAMFLYDEASKSMSANIYSESRDCTGASSSVGFDSTCDGGSSGLSCQWEHQ